MHFSRVIKKSISSKSCKHFSSGLLCYFTGQHLTVSFCCLKKQLGQIANYTLPLTIMEVENYSKRKETIYWRDPFPTSMMEKEYFGNPNCKRPFREVASHASSTEEVLQHLRIIHVHSTAQTVYQAITTTLFVGWRFWEACKPSLNFPYLEGKRCIIPKKPSLFLSKATFLGNFFL